MSGEKGDDAGSIGSDTFREQRRKQYEECETDEQLFNQHNNIQSIFDNRHHDLQFDDDLNSAGSSLGGYSNLDDNASKGQASVRTREELRLSLIARRRRLAQMENAMEGDGSIDFSLRLAKPDRDAGSLVSSLRDSIISLNDSLQGSLLSRKKKKKSKDSKKKAKKKKSSKDKERERRKEKERREKEKKKKKRKEKEREKERQRKSKKSDKKRKSKHHSSSSESSSESESEDSEEEYSSRRPSNGHGGDRDRRNRRSSEDDYGARGVDKGRGKAKGGRNDYDRRSSRGDKGAAKPLDRGVPRDRRPDNRRSKKVESDSSSSSSSSSSAPSRRKAPQAQTQQRPVNRRGEPQPTSRRDVNVGRRGPGDPRGTSQPPRRMARQPQHSQRGASVSSRAMGPGGRNPQQRQQSQRRPHRSDRSVDPPSTTSSRDPSLMQSHSTLQSQSTQKMGMGRERQSSRKHPPKTGNNHRGAERRGGRDRMISQEQPPSRTRSVSTQRISSAVDFDPAPNRNRRGATGAERIRSPGNGGSYEEEKKEQHLMNQSSSNVFDSRYERGMQKARSNTFHGAPPSRSSKTEHPRRGQKPAAANLEEMGISSQDLMNFVMAQSGANLDASAGNLGDLEQALMDQVRRLSIGSGDEMLDGNADDPKFAVLREVVKSYMNGEVSMENVNQLNGGQRGAGVPKREERPSYNLGDEGRRRDMVKDDDKDVALMRIASLQPDDPAFIRRTTGKWTFAKVKQVSSDSIVFFVNPNGSSKAYNVKYWVSHIRTLKAPEGGSAAENDASGRRGAFARQNDATRFSIKGLRASDDGEEY